MPLPQVNERIKEVPAQALRAVFAGIGQVLLVADKIRNRAVEQVSGTATTAAPPREAPPSVPTAAPSTAPAESPSADHLPEVTEIPATPAASEAPAAPQAPAAPEATKPGAEATKPGAEATEPGALPLSNYDELTIASLRARLRVLSPSQISALLEYEKVTEGRPAVITMFERRLAKLEQEGS